MKKTALRITAVAALATLGAPAFAAFDANIEFDNTYLNDRTFTDIESDGEGGFREVKRKDKRGLQQSGRVELNASGKAGPDVFIAGRASFLAKKDGSVATDDMWVQAGTSAFDVKLGRFEAADLFPLPRDVLVLYADGGSTDVGTFVYRNNALRGRTGGNVFHAAGTFNAGGGLSVELGVVETKNATPDVVAKGVRPVVSYVSGPLTIRAGGEFGKYNNGDNNGGTFEKLNGFGFTAGYNIGGVTLIGNYAHVKLNNFAPGVDLKQDTFGLIANADMGIAGGVIFSKSKVPNLENFKITTFYAAYNMPFAGIAGATISPAISYSKSGGSNDSPDEKGIRLRFNYAF